MLFLIQAGAATAVPGDGKNCTYCTHLGADLEADQND